MARQHEVIVVAKHDEFAARRLDAFVAGGDMSFVVAAVDETDVKLWIQGGDIMNGDAAVIDNDHLKMAVCLPAQRLEQLGKRIRAIVRRDDDRYERAQGIHRLSS